jgi:hypothetical protein
VNFFVLKIVFQILLKKNGDDILVSSPLDQGGN